MSSKKNQENTQPEIKNQSEIEEENKIAERNQRISRNVRYLIDDNRPARNVLKNNSQKTTKIKLPIFNYSYSRLNDNSREPLLNRYMSSNKKRFSWCSCMIYFVYLITVVASICLQSYFLLVKDKLANHILYQRYASLGFDLLIILLAIILKLCKDGLFRVYYVTDTSVWIQIANKPNQKYPFVYLDFFKFILASEIAIQIYIMMKEIKISYVILYVGLGISLIIFILGLLLKYVSSL